MLPQDIEKKKYYIAGYSENNPAAGVIDPQYVCALWLDDRSGYGGRLFLSFDAVGILSSDAQRIRDKLSDFRSKTGCREIYVFSTHNHAGIDTMGLWGPLPRTGRDAAFMKLLFNGAREAAESAYEDRRQGRLFYGRAEVPDMQEDIRTPEVYSKFLTRFRFVPDDSSREIWLLNFASHSESLQGCNHLVSADFPCYLREHIRETTGAETVYTVGAIGGMISMLIENEDLLRREHRLLESTRSIGRRLAEFAINITEERELAPTVCSVTQEFYVPVDNPMLTLAGLLSIIDVERYFVPRPAVKTRLSYLELGGIPLLFLPCELFPELAYGGCLSAEASATGKGPEINPPSLLEITGSPDTVIFGLADDELGYVIPPNDFYLHPDKPYLDKGIDRHNRRHYEETNSAGPDTAFAIAEALQKVMRNVDIAKQKNKENNDA
ncbi:MAG: hypothetical protein K6C36_06905 [Clostridia bacterium]|nr:hypothetical protein [Clostridia bacterium]